VSDFSRLVSEQMATMEKLLYIQTELERCQEIEEELKLLQKHAKLESIQDEIQQMKQDLREIHQIFERQTEELIKSYQKVEIALKS
jgi:hypothetical protein